MSELGPPNTPFWAKCPGCGHCWPAAYYPLDLGEFGRVIGKAVCPKGCKDRPVIAKQTNGTLEEESAE